MSGERPTPAQGTPTIPADEQAVYDAGQDARLRDHSTQLQAIRAEVAAASAHEAGQDAELDRLRLAVVTVGLLALAALVVALAAHVRSRPSQPQTPPALHLACPAAPAATCAPTLTCAACPACPATRSHRRD